MVSAEHEPRFSVALLLAWFLHGLAIAAVLALPSASRRASEPVQVLLVMEGMQSVQQEGTGNSNTAAQPTVKPKRETTTMREVDKRISRDESASVTPATVTQPQQTSVSFSKDERPNMLQGSSASGEHQSGSDISGASFSASKAAGGTPGGSGNKDLEVGAGDGPRFVRRQMPVYPMMARKQGKEGRVVLRLFIDEGGRLQDVQVSEGSGSAFTESAIAAVRKSTFGPALRNGTPVASWALLTVRFVLKTKE